MGYTKKGWFAAAVFIVTFLSVSFSACGRKNGAGQDLPGARNQPSVEERGTSAVYRGGYSRSGNFNTEPLRSFSSARVLFDSGNLVTTSPVRIGNSIYFGTSEGFVYNLEHNGGKLQWRFSTAGAVYSAPAVADNRVFAGSSGGSMYCIEARTGEQVWGYEGSKGFVGSPILTGGNVYAVDGNGDVYAWNTVKGNIVWKKELSSGSIYTPALSGTLLIVPDTGGYLHALRTDSGDRVWLFRSDSPFITAPVVAAGRIYIGTVSGMMYCLSAGDGSTLWTYGGDGSFCTEAAVGGGVVYFGTMDGLLCALDAATGDPVWEKKSPRGFFVAPSAAGSMLYMPVIGADVLGIDISEGDVLWRYTPENSLTATLTPSVDGLLAGDEKGRLILIEGSPSDPVKLPPGQLSAAEAGANPEAVVPIQEDTGQDTENRAKADRAGTGDELVMTGDGFPRTFTLLSSEGISILFRPIRDGSYEFYSGTQATTPVIMKLTDGEGNVLAWNLDNDRFENSFVWKVKRGTSYNIEILPAHSGQTAGSIMFLIKLLRAE